MSYYSSGSNVHWRIQHWIEPECAFRLNNHKLKTYLYHSNTFVKTGPTITVNYLLSMNYSKDTTIFELMYRTSCNRKCLTNWTPVPVDVMERMFKRENGEWDFCTIYNDGSTWRDNTKIVVQDGHFLFKYDTEWLRIRLGSIAQETLIYSVPGQIVYQLNDNLAIALAYPEKKYTMADTIAIDGAIRQIRGVEWCIEREESGGDSRKSAMLENLQKAKSELANYEKNYQMVLEKAADALNILSTKYNVDIDI